MPFSSATVFILSFLTLPLIFSSPVRAQDAKKPNEDVIKKEIEKKALEFLDQLVAESASFSSPENRITVLLEAAQISWSRDEARSRKILTDLKEQFSGNLYQPYSRVPTQRAQTLDWLAAKNAGLALDFMRSTRAPSPLAEENRTGYEDERQIELRLASTVAASNPQLAFQLAQDFLKTDVDGQVLDIWQTLRRSDPKLGKKLTDDLIAVFKSDDLLTNSNHLATALNLLNQIKPSRDNENNYPESIDADRQAYREVLDLVAGAAVKFMSDKSTDPNRVSGASFFPQISALLPEIESQFPARAAALRVKVAQLEKIFPNNPSGQVSEYERKLEDMRGKSVKELLAMASSEPNVDRGAVFIEAIKKAAAEGDLETARKIANEHVASYPYLKRDLSQFASEFADKRASEGKYDEARRAISNLGSDEEKVLSLVRFSSSVLSKKDETTARGFLEEASAILGAKMRMNQQLSAQIAIAVGYRDLDPDRSFEIMEAAIERLNQVCAAAKEYLTYSENNEGELSLESGAIIEMISSFAPGLAQLADKDFERAAAIIKRAQIAEMRVKLGLRFLSDLLN
jgi:hypothetical protein